MNIESNRWPGDTEHFLADDKDFKNHIKMWDEFLNEERRSYK